MKRLLVILCLIAILAPIAPVHAAPMGWVIIPSIALYAPIHTAPIVDNMHQIGGGVGHLEGTTWVNDEWGRVVLAAHTPGKFAGLSALQIGDRIIVISDTGAYEFEVTTMTIIDDDVRWLAPTEAYTLTLLTCDEQGVTWLAVNAKAVD